MKRCVRKLFVLLALFLMLDTGICDWIGQPFWDEDKMSVSASSSFTPGLSEVQTVSGYEGTLIGDLHNNNGTGYGMWLSKAGGGAAENPSPSGTDGAAWIMYDFGSVYELDTLWVWNYNQNVAVNRGFRNVIIEYSHDSYTWSRLGEFEFAQAPGTDQMPHNIEIDFGGVTAKYVVLIAAVADGNWGDAGPYYGLSEVRFFGTQYSRSLDPWPVNGAVCVDVDDVFVWTPAAGEEYDVYLGTDFQSLQNAFRPDGDIDTNGVVDFMDLLVMGTDWLLGDTRADLTQDSQVTLEDFSVVAEKWMKSASSEFKVHSDSGIYTQGELQPCENYFWRVDIFSDSGVEKGEVWNFSTCCGTAREEYYISPDGNDDNPGTITEPLATLEGARDLLRCKCLPAGGTTVYLRQGKYFRTDEFQLTGQDSGTAGKTITYCAYPGEEVRIIGGKELPGQWFSPVVFASPAWQRLPAGARPYVYQVDLGAHGITDYGDLPNNRLELSFNGQILNLARWPNTGYAPIVYANSETTFTYSGTEPGKWSTATEPWAAGYWNYGWHYEYEPIVGIDTNAKRISLASVPGYGIITGGQWCALNLLEELDEPGEWYLERSTGVLYLWPPSSLELGEIIISMLGDVNTPLIEGQSVNYVTFRDITLEMCRFRAVKLNSCRDVCFDNCLIRNTGEDGVVVSSGHHNVVKNCTFYGIGGRGIYLDGGNRYSLQAGQHCAVNNVLHQFSRWYRANWPGIQLVGVGNRVEHNQLSDAPHSAIFYHGNDHLIQFNEIYNVCYETDDAGAIMSDRDWGHRGNSIRHNFIHHVDSNSSYTLGVHGIYYDGCTCGHDVYGNVFYEITGNIFFVNGGRDNSARNNVIAKCGTAVASCRGGKVWINEIPGNSFNLLEKIEAVNYTQPPYSTAYPALANILSEGYEQAKEPKGNFVSQNIGWANSRWSYDYCIGGCGAFDYFLFEDNIMNQDPLFVDESSLNLALREDSPAYSIAGFERIPFEWIGTLLPGKASRPNPADEKTLTEAPLRLYWAPALNAASYGVYFADTLNAATDANELSESFCGYFTETSFEPGISTPGTYYWRIDAYDQHNNLLEKGQVWSFSF